MGCAWVVGRGRRNWYVHSLTVAALYSTADTDSPDIAFGDSHAIWTQHLSGTFSQIDLRDSTKPLDAIPRASASWEASGALAFTTDRASQWELPYDDVLVTQSAKFA